MHCGAKQGNALVRLKPALSNEDKRQRIGDGLAAEQRH
jgi:hypothetical protein